MPETPEEVIARRRAAMAAGGTTATLDAAATPTVSPEEVLRRRRANIAFKRANPPDLAAQDFAELLGSHAPKPLR